MASNGYFLLSSACTHTKLGQNGREAGLFCAISDTARMSRNLMNRGPEGGADGRVGDGGDVESEQEKRDREHHNISQRRKPAGI